MHVSIPRLENCDQVRPDTSRFAFPLLTFGRNATSSPCGSGITIRITAIWKTSCRSRFMMSYQDCIPQIVEALVSQSVGFTGRQSLAKNTSLQRWIDDLIRLLNRSSVWRVRDHGANFVREPLLAGFGQYRWSDVLVQFQEHI